MAAENEQAGDHADEIESLDDEEIRNMITFPNIMSTLHSQQLEELLAGLPLSVKRRIKALKKIQFEYTNLEVDFFKEVHALECKYHNLYTPLYEKREKIVSGKYEPNEEECEWQSDDEENISTEMKEKATIENKDEGADVIGIPDFWLTIFKNCRILAEMVQPHDEPIMKHLIDIKTTCEVEPMTFTLEFFFTPNDYFTNSVLEKKYFLKCVPDKDEPFEFEGPEITKCTGCKIDWNKGKNVTVKTIRKKQKHKNRGVVRTVQKTVSNDSFFNFFSPPIVPEDSKEDEVDDEIHQVLTTDFEIGHYIRERIIPRAVLYFTGEGIEDEEEDFEEEEDDDDDEEDDEADAEDSKNLKDNEKDPKCKQQ